MAYAQLAIILIKVSWLPMNVLLKTLLGGIFAIVVGLEITVWEFSWHPDCRWSLVLRLVDNLILHHIIIIHLLSVGMIRFMMTNQLLHLKVVVWLWWAPLLCFSNIYQTTLGILVDTVTHRAHSRVVVLAIYRGWIVLVVFVLWLFRWFSALFLVRFLSYWSLCLVHNKVLVMLHVDMGLYWGHMCIILVTLSLYLSILGDLLRLATLRDMLWTFTMLFGLLNMPSLEKNRLMALLWLTSSSVMCVI